MTLFSGSEMAASEFIPAPPPMEPPSPETQEMEQASLREANDAFTTPGISGGSRRSALARKAPAAAPEKPRSAEAEKDRVLGEKYAMLEMRFQKLKKEANELNSAGSAIVEKSSLVPEDAPLEDRYAALEHDYQEVKKGLDCVLNPGAASTLDTGKSIAHNRLLKAPEESMAAMAPPAYPASMFTLDVVLLYPDDPALDLQTYHVNGRKWNYDDLKKQLARTGETDPDQTLIIYCDPNARYSKLTQMMDTCRQSGLNRLVLLVGDKELDVEGFRHYSETIKPPRDTPIKEWLAAALAADKGQIPPPPLSETTFDVDAAMYRLLGGSDSEIRNYLVGKGIVLNAEGSVSYDAAAGKLILRHRPDDLKTIQGVVDAIRATAEEQRELSHGLPFIKTGVNPVSTFSIDVDTASYALARRYLQQGQRPPPERVRPEEFINAFDYAYRSPENALFGVYLEASPDPFRPEHTLFRIGVQGRRLGADVNRPSQFTLLIDTSGSMGRQDRIGLAKKSVSLLLDQMRPQDRIAVLTCGYRSQILVPFTPAARRKIIERLVAGLQPQGEANLERGFVAAYQYALDNFQAGAGNRVILFTDGIAGFGANDADTILAQVEVARRQGVTNTVVGFGGDGNDDLLEALANRGDGSYVFLNNEDDARSLFQKEFAARFHEIARDVKIQVEFNPARVAAYRQIGYQNRQLSKADFRNDQVDAGEVGAGQSVTALYELQPFVMAMHQGDALRQPNQPLATVRIRYRRSDTLEIEEREFYLLPENLKKRFDDTEPSFQLAAAVAEFAESLRYPEVPGIASPSAVFGQVERLYGSAYRSQPDVHEFMTLVGRVK
jgi:Ca-activated chloride channel family protein